MKKVEALDKVEEILRQIEKGAFLTVQAGGRRNTMTIGWATMGICWRKPVFMIAVRDSRYTFELLESGTDFSVTLPARGMRDEVFYCGTKSGRDVDKFEECQLKTLAGQKITSPVIDTPGTHIECRVIYKSAMNPAFLDGALMALYPEKDFHTLYFGEIVACYQTD